MARASIPVDLLNPGQVFACIGFLEAADVLLGCATGGFDWSEEAIVQFRLGAAGDANPFAVVLEFLAEAKVVSRAPVQSGLSTARWNVPTLEIDCDVPFPFPAPMSPATLPTMLTSGAGATIMIDHWGDTTCRDRVKFWDGAGGYPGAALARDALDIVREKLSGSASDPFALSAPQSSSFRFDWRRDYIPIDLGFSPNQIKNIYETTMVGFPIVEILAAIGLCNARPKYIDRLHYEYSVVGGTELKELLDPVFLRAALGGAPLPFLQRAFRMNLGWVGQEDKARCITVVTEEIWP